MNKFTAKDMLTDFDSLPPKTQAFFENLVDDFLEEVCGTPRNKARAHPTSEPVDFDVDSLVDAMSEDEIRFWQKAEDRIQKFLQTRQSPVAGLTVVDPDFREHVCLADIFELEHNLGTTLAVVCVLEPAGDMGWPLVLFSRTDEGLYLWRDGKLETLPDGSGAPSNPLESNSEPPLLEVKSPLWEESQ